MLEKAFRKVSRAKYLQNPNCEALPTSKMNQANNSKPQRQVDPVFCNLCNSFISSEVFGFGPEGQNFIVVVDFKLTFGFFVVKVEGYRHRFCSAELYLPGLEESTYGCHAFAQHPFQCLPVSISMHNF